LLFLLVLFPIIVQRVSLRSFGTNKSISKYQSHTPFIEGVLHQDGARRTGSPVNGATEKRDKKQQTDKGAVNRKPVQSKEGADGDRGREKAMALVSYQHLPKVHGHTRWHVIPGCGQGDIMILKRGMFLLF